MMLGHLLLTVGMKGEPVPYMLRSDWMVTSVLFACMLLVSYVLSQGDRYISHRIKTFFAPRERTSIFDEVTTSDVRYTLLLILLACVLLAFCVYNHFAHTLPALFDAVPHGLLLGGFTTCIFVFVILKRLFYNLVNWAFFSKTRNMIWANAYFSVVMALGLSLFPFVLLMVYFDLSPQISAFLVGFLIFLAKSVLLCKCFNNFFNNFRGSFHLILYFCALEIVPDLVLWKGIELISNNLI